MNTQQLVPRGRSSAVREPQRRPRGGRDRMIGVLLVALAGAAIGVSCTSTAVELPADPVYDELFGEVTEVVLASDAHAIVSLKTSQETVWLPAGPETHVSVGGFVIPPVELVDCVGFSAVVLCRREGEVCRETRFIGVEPRPRRKRT